MLTSQLTSQLSAQVQAQLGQAIGSINTRIAELEQLQTVVEEKKGKKKIPRQIFTLVTETIKNLPGMADNKSPVPGPLGPGDPPRVDENGAILHNPTWEGNADGTQPLSSPLWTLSGQTKKRHVPCVKPYLRLWEGVFGLWLGVLGRLDLSVNILRLWCGSLISSAPGKKSGKEFSQVECKGAAKLSRKLEAHDAILSFDGIKRLVALSPHHVAFLPILPTSHPPSLSPLVLRDLKQGFTAYNDSRPQVDCPQ
ncbi:hypothetical protein B0H14DRAFT_2567789 [Mycena olivaceomarginata]|nr:hypothetical protein B0H14DRAFT_2567789 [Mycena olivaceomarginata]